MGARPAHGRAVAIAQKERLAELATHARQVYTPETNAWAMGPRMGARRFTTAAAALGGAIYITGGFDGAAYLASTEMLDPRAPGWQLVCARPGGCSDTASLIILGQS